MLIFIKPLSADTLYTFYLHACMEPTGNMRNAVKLLVLSALIGLIGDSTAQEIHIGGCPNVFTAQNFDVERVSNNSVLKLMTALMRKAIPGLEVIKLFSCSTQLSMKFSLLINMKMPSWHFHIY